MGQPADAPARLAPAPSDADKLPVPLPSDCPPIVNHPPDPAELETLRHSVLRSAPLGAHRWTAGVVRTLGLEATQRPPDRPGKPKSVRS